MFTLGMGMINRRSIIDH